MFSLTQPLPSFTLLSACSGQAMSSCGLAVAATAGQAEPWEVCSDASHVMILHRQIPAPTLGSVSAEKSLLLGAPAPPHAAGQLLPIGKGYAAPFFLCQHGGQWLSQKSLLGKLSSSLFYNQFSVYFLGLKNWRIFIFLDACCT